MKNRLEILVLVMMIVFATSPFSIQAQSTSTRIINKIEAFPAPRVNKTTPISDAVGPHTTFKANPTGQVTKYETWATNPQNPSGFDSFKRVDTQYANPHIHYNNVTKQPIPTPHVHDKNNSGGVRPAMKSELPK